MLEQLEQLEWIVVVVPLITITNRVDMYSTWYY